MEVSLKRDSIKNGNKTVVKGIEMRKNVKNVGGWTLVTEGIEKREKKSLRPVPGFCLGDWRERDFIKLSTYRGKAGFQGKMEDLIWDVLSLSCL